MTLAVKVDEPFYPVDVGFLGAGTVVPPPDSIAYLIQEAWGLRWCFIYPFVHSNVRTDKCIESA
jgi:hypothetical protein